MGKNHEGHKAERSHAGGFDDVDHIIDARITPHPLVKIEQIKGDDLDEKDDGKNVAHHRRRIGGDIEVEAQEVREIPAKGHEEHVYGENNEKIPIDVFRHGNGWSGIEESLHHRAGDGKLI